MSQYNQFQFERRRPNKHSLVDSTHDQFQSESKETFNLLIETRHYGCGACRRGYSKEDHQADRSPRALWIVESPGIDRIWIIKTLAHLAGVCIVMLQDSKGIQFFPTCLHERCIDELKKIKRTYESESESESESKSKEAHLMPSDSFDPTRVPKRLVALCDIQEMKRRVHFHQIRNLLQTADQDLGLVVFMTNALPETILSEWPRLSWLFSVLDTTKTHLGSRMRYDQTSQERAWATSLVDHVLEKKAGQCIRVWALKTTIEQAFNVPSAVPCDSVFFESKTLDSDSCSCSCSCSCHGGEYGHELECECERKCKDVRVPDLEQKQEQE